ncbi:hypothetical protein SERLADRAFT_467936 [Serpula lacrymans var. lacrymans S7.9]|uniref:Uncharacterized protein n=1 Tax=Serpula lacrymans var. lacrymans (strain S7.9) TaxID=578457 RepID=F8NX33_SERL9|nr:uncharacterized protein SERLADRAFT_467936 [Serpula lacrymans var. lacrymans S7.9]EGO24508.1 hypothetical protein SERLADRAFT_467936 [Serpula lacrymans var. lacrymans S7.9]
MDMVGENPVSSSPSSGWLLCTSVNNVIVLNSGHRGEVPSIKACLSLFKRRRIRDVRKSMGTERLLMAGVERRRYKSTSLGILQPDS